MAFGLVAIVAVDDEMVVVGIVVLGGVGTVVVRMEVSISKYYHYKYMPVIIL